MKPLATVKTCVLTDMQQLKHDPPLQLLENYTANGL